MSKFKRFIYQFYFWVNISRSISCKHCCIGCKYYNECLDEFTDLEKHITPKTYFD